MSPLTGATSDPQDTPAGHRVYDDLPGFFCVLGFWCFQCFFHILLTAADIANAVVVNLHGLGRVFRPLYLFLVDHDPLNEQPQQLWRQLRDI